MRRLVLIGLTMHLIGLIAIVPASAETATQEARLRAQIGEAYTLADDGKPGEAIKLLDAVIAELEQANDPEALILALDVLGYAGRLENDKAVELRGNSQSLLLNYRESPLNSAQTVIAGFALAESFRRKNMPEPQFFALIDVLAAVDGARRTGPVSAEMEQNEAMAAALLGQTMWNADRAELSLPLFRRAQALARKGAIDAKNAAKLDAITLENEKLVAERAAVALPGPDDCKGGPQLGKEQMAECQFAADRAAGLGDVALADRILTNILADVPEGSMRAERYTAGRDLFMLRMLNRPADDPGTLATADLVGNYLASIIELQSASLIGARAARAVVETGVPNGRVAELCGHIARRAIRYGAPEITRRMLEMERRVILAGLSPTDTPLSALPRKEQVPRVNAALLGLEIAQISAADLPRLAAAERDAVEHLIEGIDIADFERIEDITTVEYAERKVYLYPTYAAAVDFVGRLARRLPTQDPRHDATRIGWISAIETWWGDTKRADAMAEQSIREIRAAPEGRQRALSILLTLRAEMADQANPALTARFTREAYEAISNLPGEASERIELLIDMAADQSDTAMSRALITEAQKVRNSGHGKVEARTVARLDLKRAFIAFEDGDEDTAVKLGDGAIAAMVEDGKKDNWSIRTPAISLAGLYAALGRMDDARRIYQTYVFPQSDPTLVGEEKALDDQLSLVNLQAYYAPNDTTLKDLADLLSRTRTRVKDDGSLERRIVRAQAFAYHGIGDGPRAAAAARTALRRDRSPANDTTEAQEDRKLLEALVGAAWLGSHQASLP